MSLIDKETEEKFRLELESFIEEKKSQVAATGDKAMIERFETSMSRMRLQMEQLIKILQFKNEETKD